MTNCSPKCFCHLESMENPANDSTNLLRQNKNKNNMWSLFPPSWRWALLGDASQSSRKWQTTQFFSCSQTCQLSSCLEPPPKAVYQVKLAARMPTAKSLLTWLFCGWFTQQSHLACPEREACRQLNACSFFPKVLVAAGHSPQSFSL